MGEWEVGGLWTGVESEEACQRRGSYLAVSGGDGQATIRPWNDGMGLDGRRRGVEQLELREEPSCRGALRENLLSFVRSFLGVREFHSLNVKIRNPLNRDPCPEINPRKPATPAQSTQR